MTACGELEQSTRNPPVGGFCLGLLDSDDDCPSLEKKSKTAPDNIHLELNPHPKRLLLFFFFFGHLNPRPLDPGGRAGHPGRPTKGHPLAPAVLCR